MEEIEFRAWDVLNKKMLNWGDIFHLPAWEIFPGTPEQRSFNIMQYTGMEDKSDLNNEVLGPNERETAMPLYALGFRLPREKDEE